MDAISRLLSERTVTLPGGAHLELRQMGAGDITALIDLYDRLPTEDLRYRFFNVYHPQRDFFEHQLERVGRGGFALVAVSTGPPEQVVGDAEYVLLPDGGGELAVTVAPGWRGWLGPYLLDALVAVAAANGVPNLQADVLADNARMLALFRHRGFAIVDDGDVTVLRVAIGTTAPMPSWPRGVGSPVLLVESGSPRPSVDEAAQEAGWRVVTCPGPERWSGVPCPALRGQSCSLAGCAGAILVGWEGSPRHAALTAAHGRLHAGTAVRSLASGQRGERVLEMLPPADAKPPPGRGGEPGNHPQHQPDQ